MRKHERLRRGDMWCAKFIVDDSGCGVIRITSTGLQIGKENSGVSHISENKCVLLFKQIDKMIVKGRMMIYLYYQIHRL